MDQYTRADAADSAVTIELDELPFAAATVSRDGLLLADVNVAFAALLRTDVPTLRYRSLVELLPRGEARIIRAALHDLASGPRQFDVSLGLAPDLRRRGQLTLVPRAGLAGAVELLMTFIDLTDERDDHDAIRRSRTALETVTRRVGHDLKQPLTVVAGFARMLAEAGADLDDVARARVQARMAEAATRAAEQVTRLVDPAPKQADEHAAVKMTDVSSWLEGLTALSFDQVGGLLINDIVDEEVDVDQGVLRQVLLNLVNNALEHGRCDRPLQVHVTSRRVADGLELLVSDNGPGIPDDSLSDVFAHGVQLGGVTARGRGTGLAMSRRLSEEIGGWLSAVPFEGGARFVLWLPVRTVQTTEVPTSERTEQVR